MTTKKEQDRRNFEHTLEVLVASAMAERDLAAASTARAADTDRWWRSHRYALVATVAVLLILVPAVVWRIGGGGRVPLVRLSDSGTNQIKSDDPGGQKFAHADKKLFNRLSEAVVPASEPAAAASVPARPPSAPVNVPGVMLENLGAPQNVAPPAAAPMPQPPPAAPVQVASVAPPASETPAVEAPAAQRSASTKPSVPEVKRAAAAPASSSSESSGFVAVLASKKSRMDALKAFADLQQKYSDVLAAKTPDVQEANLGDKGVWYRLVVGPPHSREAASALCSQLKSAGHSGCWIAAAEADKKTSAEVARAMQARKAEEEPRDKAGFSQPAAVAANAPAPSALVAAHAGSRASTGFVAVLASNASRTVALKEFADLQQKYSDVLGAKTPEVHEAKLDEGVFYRAAVGPPGSLEAANGVCMQLKSAGYSGCRVAEVPTARSAVSTTAVPEPQLAATPLQPAEREHALNLHDRGKEQLERGNILAARQFFERAAEAGLAQSAVALAATYDPNELAKLNIAGLNADVALARKWYEKARDLGAVEAADRLRRLTAR